MDRLHCRLVPVGPAFLIWPSPMQIAATPCDVSNEISYRRRRRHCCTVTMEARGAIATIFESKSLLSIVVVSLSEIQVGRVKFFSFSDRKKAGTTRGNKLQTYILLPLDRVREPKEKEQQTLQKMRHRFLTQFIILLLPTTRFFVVRCIVKTVWEAKVTHAPRTSV